MNNMQFSALDENAAAEDFIRKYVPVVEAAAKAAGLPPCYYDDVVSDVIDKFLVRKKAVYDESRGAGERTFVSRVARNTAKNLIRKYWREVKPGTEDAEELTKYMENVPDETRSVMESIADADCRNMLADGWKQLQTTGIGKRKLEIFRRHFFLKEKRTVLAAKYGLTPGQISSIAHKCLLRYAGILKDLCAEYDYDIAC